MNRRWLTAALFGLAACDGTATLDGVDADQVDVGLSDTLVACQNFRLEGGTIGAGQTPLSLASAELTGTADRWTKYVEFSRGARARCSFAAGNGAAVLAVNYRGATKAEMPVQFEAQDPTSGAWVTVLDNTTAKDWRWSVLSADVSRFVQGGQVTIRFVNGTGDASLLDQWALHAGGAAGSGGGSGSAGGGTSSSGGGTSSSGGGTSSSGGGTSSSGGGTSSSGGGTSSSGGGMSTTSWYRPAPGTSWQWQITGTIDTSVNASLFDIDLFDTPQATIDQLHALGRKVVCYFDTAYEPNRPDSAQLAPYRGNAMVGWPGQYWLDFRAQAVRDVMVARIQLARTKHCDAVEPDDVDAITNNPGIPLTAADQLAFARFLATTAHGLNMGVALKNDLDQIPQLVADFDFAVNEECFQYAECDTLKPFIAAGKAVLSTEYTAGDLATKGATICPQANALNFDTLIKHLDLGAPRYACR